MQLPLCKLNKPVTQSFAERKHGTKARLSFSGGPHVPVNVADSMEEVNVGVKNAGNSMFALLYIIKYFVCQVFANA